LSDNQLPRISKGLFDGMSILQRLFVDRLQTDRLVNGISFRYLDINMISEIDEDVFSSLPSLQTLFEAQGVCEGYS
jgi:hypothetical protein